MKVKCDGASHTSIVISESLTFLSLPFFFVIHVLKNPAIMNSGPVARGVSNRLQYRRSRNGCLTCKRRKVRCNERKPLCYHCQRLNLECVWNGADSQRSLPPSTMGVSGPSESTVTPLGVGVSFPASDLFDFNQPETASMRNFSFLQELCLPNFGDLTASGHHLDERALLTGLSPTSSSPARPQSPIASVDGAPLSLSVPPILDPVENGPRRASVQALFMHLAGSSQMVRYSITAFAAVQFDTISKKAEYKLFYDKAANELSEIFQNSEGTTPVDNTELRNVLTTIFFLTYSNVGLLHAVWFDALHCADF